MQVAVATMKQTKWGEREREINSGFAFFLAKFLDN